MQFFKIDYTNIFKTGMMVVTEVTMMKVENGYAALRDP